MPFLFEKKNDFRSLRPKRFLQKYIEVFFISEKCRDNRNQKKSQRDVIKKKA